MITGVLNHSLTRTVCWLLCLFLVCIHLIPSSANASFISTVRIAFEDSDGAPNEALQADLERKLNEEHQREIANYPNLERKMKQRELLKFVLIAVMIALIITFPEEFVALYGSGS